MRRYVLSVLMMLCFTGCGPNQRILESNNSASAAEGSSASEQSPPTVPNFEQDLNAMRTADFKFIVVFRRKDKAVLDASDKELLKNTATQANRRRLSDEGRAVIIGSNFPFPAGEFEALNERFTMENYSKADSGEMFVAY